MKKGFALWTWIFDKKGKIFGDLPQGVFNEQTSKWEETENPRGFAYALRNAMRYRKNKRREP